MEEELDYRTWVSPFYGPFLNGKFAFEAEQETGFFPLLERALEAVEPEIIEDLLRDGNWRFVLTGAYFCGLKNWRDFDRLVGRTLVACQTLMAPQGLCFALARFESHYGAHCIRGYLNGISRKHSNFGEIAWAIGALSYLDKRLKTSHAEDYLVPLALHLNQINRDYAVTLYQQHFSKNSDQNLDAIELAALEKQIDAPVAISNFDYDIAQFEQVMQFCQEQFPCLD